MVEHIGQFVTKMYLKRLSLQFLKVACSENYMFHILGIQRTDMTNQSPMLGAFHLRPDRSDWLEVKKYWKAPLFHHITGKSSLTTSFMRADFKIQSSIFYNIPAKDLLYVL